MILRPLTGMIKGFLVDKFMKPLQSEQILEEDQIRVRCGFVHTLSQRNHLALLYFELIAGWYSLMQYLSFFFCRPYLRMLSKYTIWMECSRTISRKRVKAWTPNTLIGDIFVRMVRGVQCWNRTPRNLCCSILFISMDRLPSLRCILITWRTTTKACRSSNYWRRRMTR